MKNGTRTSINGSVRCYDADREEADFVSIMLDVNSQGNYTISPDMAKSLFGNAMTAVLRGNLSSKTIAPADQANGKAVRADDK